jgi:HAE1 family hydrophobic/amphiphilic exporter-1
VIGIIFGELAVIITVTLIASLFTAVTFSPMLCAKWMRQNHTAQKGLFKKFYDFSETLLKKWEDFYARQLGWGLKHKKLVILGFSAAFIFSLFLVPFVGNEFIPSEDTGDLRITAQLPIGTRLEETEKVARRVEEIYRTLVPEAKIYYVRSGQVSGVGRAFNAASGSHVVISGAKLVPKTQRKRSVEEVGQVVRKEIRKIPGILKSDISTGNPIGRLITGMGGKAVQIEIIGHSFEDTGIVAEKVKDIIEKIPGAVDVTISRELNRPEIEIEVDREKAGILELDMNTIAESLRTYIQGQTATKYREKGETYDIYVRLEEYSRSKIEDLKNLSLTIPLPQDIEFLRSVDKWSTLKGSTRKQVKLANIAKISEKLGPLEIKRKNRERVVEVECNNYGRSSGKIVEDIKKELAKITLPADISINIGGEAEEQKKAFKDLFMLLLLGTSLVYMVMAAQFESLRDPFIIMFAIPFTFIGVILGFLFTGQTLNIISYLGIIMLMGIVVNNAIVLISYIAILRARGYSLFDAVTQGGKDRLRPVLMTTITTLVGLLPLAISNGEGSESWKPLGVTMLGGLLVSTLITMLFVPTLYTVFEQRLERKRLKK